MAWTTVGGVRRRRVLRKQISYRLFNLRGEILGTLVGVGNHRCAESNPRFSSPWKELALWEQIATTNDACRYDRTATEPRNHRDARLE